MRSVFFQELTCRAKPSTMNSQWAFLNWSFRRFFKLTSLSCYVERRSHLSIRNFATSPSCWKPCSSFISFQLCIWLRTLTCLVRASLARSAFARFSSKVVFSLGLPRNMAVVCLHLFNETPIRVTSHTVISLQLICTLVFLYSPVGHFALVGKSCYGLRSQLFCLYVLLKHVIHVCILLVYTDP